MQIVCSYTSDYFLIYDDGYERVHYDDDHVLHDIRGLDARLWITSPTMMGPWGAKRLGTHAHTCRSCLGKYTSNLV